LGGALLGPGQIMTIESKSRVQAAFETYSLSGDPSLLSFVLRSDLPLTTNDREFLADLWEGKIRQPRGKPRFSAANHLSGELVQQQPSELGRAAKRVDLQKAKIGRDARAHGKSTAIVKQIATEEGVDPEQLAARMRLPLRSRYF
jgi:hypothetical protein